MDKNSVVLIIYQKQVFIFQVLSPFLRTVNRWRCTECFLYCALNLIQMRRNVYYKLEMVVKSGREKLPLIFRLEITGY